MSFLHLGGNDPFDLEGGALQKPFASFLSTHRELVASNNDAQIHTQLPPGQTFSSHLKGASGHNLRSYRPYLAPRDEVVLLTPIRVVPHASGRWGSDFGERIRPISATRKLPPDSKPLQMCLLLLFPPPPPSHPRPMFSAIPSRISRRNPAAKTRAENQKGIGKRSPRAHSWSVERVEGDGSG